MRRNQNQGKQEKMGNFAGRGVLLAAAALALFLCAGNPASAMEPKNRTAESGSIADGALLLEKNSIFFSIVCGSREQQEEHVTVANKSGKDLVVYVRGMTEHFAAGGEDFSPSDVTGILQAVIPAEGTADLVITPKEGLVPRESPCTDSFLFTGDSGARAELIVTAEISYAKEEPVLFANGEPLSDEAYAGEVLLTAEDGSYLAGQPEGPFQKELSVSGEEESTVLCFQKKDGSVTEPKTITIPRDQKTDGEEAQEERKNRWTLPLSMESWTIAEVPKEPTAAALYGTAGFTYYDSSKNALKGKPEAPGFYFVRASVEPEGSADTGLVSSYVAFRIESAHAFGKPFFVWNDDHTQCTALFFCLYEEGHRKIVPAEVTVTRTAAACEEAGTLVYTAEAELDGRTYQDTYETEIPALGHRYTRAVFAWSEDNTACEADFVCANDSTHVERRTCRVTVNTVREADCTEDGKKVFTASAVCPDGTVCQESRTVTIPAAHALVEENGVFVCEVCGKKFSDAEGLWEIR